MIAGALARGHQVLTSWLSTRRVELCWEATRAPRWTRIPQAWAIQPVAQAGLLRDRAQSEKSQGFGDRVPESFPDQTKTKTAGKSALAFSANRRFTLNQYIFISLLLGKIARN